VLDRTVSVRLRADVAGYIAQMRAAAAATRQVAGSAGGVGRQATSGFDQATSSAKGLSRTLDATGKSAARAADQVARAALAARRAQLSAAEATEKAEHAQKEAAKAAERLARGEISEAQAAQAAARAQRQLERADIAHASAAHASADASRRQADQLNQVERSSVTATRGLTANRSTLVALIAGAVGAGAAAASAAGAFVAFAAVAAPSIVRVVSAQEDLATNWGTLSRQQRVSAAQVAALVTEYKALGRSYEPESLRAFNSLVDTGRALLPRFGAVVDATSGDVERFVNRISDFTLGRVGGEFLTWSGEQAPEALDVLGTTLTTAGDTALDLVQDLAPLGISLLELTNGTLGLINGIASINPGFAQFAVTALMLRSPISGLVGGVERMGDRMRTASTAAQGASKSTRLLNLVTAVGPNLYVAAGVGLGFLALKAMSAKSSTDRLVESLQVQNRATGNNISGYRALINELEPRLTTAMQNNAEVQQRLRDGNISASEAMKKVTLETDKYREAIAQADLRIRNIAAGTRQLGERYGLTSTQATRLADAAGVDLSNSIDKSGQLTAEAAAKIDRYRQAAELAANPTRQVALALADAGNKALTMKDRVTALTAALDAYFNPSIAVFKATTQLKSGYDTLISSLVDAKGRMDGNTAASVQLRTAFATQLEAVSALRTATFQQTGSLEKANAVAGRQLPILYALAGRNREAREQVDALARSTGNSTGRQNIARGAFLSVADSMGISRARAASLWKEYNKIPPGRSTKITTPGIGDAIRASKDMRAAVLSVPSSRTITYYVRNQGNAIRASKAMGNADGNVLPTVRSYASGGENHVAQIDSKGITRVWAEPETGGEAYIPLAASKRPRSTAILADVADRFGLQLVRRMADGGILGFADGGVSLSDFLSRWEAAVQPASSSDVTSAIKARRTQLDQLRNAEAALRRARKTHDGDKIAAAERRVRKERVDLTDATRKLTSVEARYQAGRQSPATRLGSALALGIRNNSAFISNLTKLADRGFGGLAQQLLAMGGPDAEKIAADAAKFSDKKLKTLSGHLDTASKQQQTLANLPAILAARSVLKKSNAGTWMDLVRVSGMPPEDLAAALKLMKGDLLKTTNGQTIWAQMIAQGYQHGGWVRGPGGIDRVPIAATSGEFMVARGPARQYAPALEAINGGRFDAMLRRYVYGRGAAAIPVQGGDGASAAAGSQWAAAGERHVHIHFDRVEIREGVDVDMVMDQAAFRARTADFGS
jgi:hypothetical protein